MKNNDYLLPGIAAIGVAILFPITWIYELASSFSNMDEYRFSFQFGVSSFLFLLLGLASI